MGKKAQGCLWPFWGPWDSHLRSGWPRRHSPLISEAKFNPQDVLSSDKAQDMYWETERGKDKTKGSIHPFLSHCGFWAGSPVKDGELWNVLAQQEEGVFTRLSCNVQRRKLSIRWERRAAIPSRWDMMRTGKGLHWRMKHHQMKSNEGGG